MLKRIAIALFVLAVALLATFLVLKGLWFEGSIGCDDEDTAAARECNRKADIVVWIAWIDMGVIAAWLLSMAALALSRLRGPSRTRRASSPRRRPSGR